MLEALKSDKKESRDTDEIGAALKKFVWYYGVLGASIILAFIFGRYMESSISEAIFITLLIIIFSLGHIMAVFYMPTMIREARKAMDMYDINGLSFLLQIISFFVFAWPMHILGIMHFYKLLRN